MSVGKKRSGDVRIGTPAAPWFVSYSDLMTQLLIFFVMLFALSGAATEDQLKKIKNKIDITDNELLKSVNIRIPDNLYIDIKTLAAIKMTSISAIVETALKEYLENI